MAIPAAARFYNGFDVDENECWIWQKQLSPDGYGRFKVNGEQIYAHIYSYNLFIGPVPDGLELDHRCRVHSCVNPDHLEAVTHRENTLRGTGPTAVNARKTHCDHGHEFTVENTRIAKGKRHCRACCRIRVAESYARKKAKNA